METPSQVEDAMQQGRGELTPAAITRAVQNLADNPLAARMHGSKLLNATQVADTSAMSQLNYTLERQKQLGPGFVRRRRGPVKFDWSKRKVYRV